MVNEKRMRETFEELVRIYAPSKREREVCDLLKKKLKALGASEIIEDNNGSVGGGDSGNLIAVFPANAEGLPSVALTAHTWTVWNAAGGLILFLRTVCTVPAAEPFSGVMTKRAWRLFWRDLR